MPNINMPAGEAPALPALSILQSVLMEAAASELPDEKNLTKLSCDFKADGSIVTKIDSALQSAIAAKLNQYWPQIPLLGEEMPQDEQMQMIEHAKQGLWVLDPLDGTTNFTTGVPLFGISLAYVKQGITEMAVVYDPSCQECFSAERGHGAYLNNQRLKSVENVDLENCIANIDYKRLTNALASQLVSCPPYRSQRNIGSCVLEWCWLAANRFQLYLHGGQHLWDHAAGRLILEEAGGVATRIDGSKLTSNKLLKQSAVAASNKTLHQAWIAWLDQAT